MYFGFFTFASNMRSSDLGCGYTGYVLLRHFARLTSAEIGYDIRVTGEAD
jgi:hypothetical protein